MPLLEKNISDCELCGAPLKSGANNLGCLNCLLLGGPNEAAPEARHFQHYEICLCEDGVTLDELGRGAMGTTYRAVDVNLGSTVALKVISARYSENPQARERFRHEARVAAQLRHANVASVFHFGETGDGKCFYAMELIEGETLDALVRRDGAMSVPMALDLAIQIGHALNAAEVQGLVHRDLKPDNVMVVTGDPRDALVVKVIDFDLAKAVAALPVVRGQINAGFSGTPAFASPEQLSAGKTLVDGRSDIYSLGATLWFLLSGQAPFADPTPEKMRDLPLRLEPLVLRKVPRAVLPLLCSMLAADPADRPQSARELLHALQRCRQIVKAIPRHRKRRRLATFAAGLSIISAFGLTSYLSHRKRIAPHVATAAPPEKSIAVLPFENLGDDKQNAYLADAIQDEILTDLAKIAAIKVIGRTSVIRYRSGVTRNLREIGEQLGVAHLVEGSVQRSGGKVRVNAQLIDAQSNKHLWSETYDRDLADVFAIQTDIALRIAGQLQATLTPKARAAIEERPTKDLAAYDLYVRAKLLVDNPVIGGGRLEEAAKLLDEALVRDRDFFLAHCLSAKTHGTLYGLFEHTQGQRDLAEAAVAAAFRLRPDAGEAHLARASYLSQCERNYDRARTEVALPSGACLTTHRSFSSRGPLIAGRVAGAPRRLA